MLRREQARTIVEMMNRINGENGAYGQSIIEKLPNRVSENARGEEEKIIFVNVQLAYNRATVELLLTIEKSIGDDIARIYGLDEVTDGELVEFEEGTIRIALNLESNNVGVVLMGDGLMIQEGSSVKAIERIVKIPHLRVFPLMKKGNRSQNEEEKNEAAGSDN
ncbi:unnamed protein product [Lupinus luteus]|uniref:ATPase F1/V1/A1 complex alpha/beta subunit N-terminal domain-containing protein n=1 Tax=Lupinus luteus TaxID=3873 RepID=A0AAV1X664_LUPLU